MSNEIRIGEIGNYYGGLYVKKKKKEFFFGIENYSGTHWELISESLYNQLLDHNDSSEGNISKDNMSCQDKVEILKQLIQTA